MKTIKIESSSVIHSILFFEILDTLFHSCGGGYCMRSWLPLAHSRGFCFKKIKKKRDPIYSYLDCTVGFNLFQCLLYINWSSFDDFNFQILIITWRDEKSKIEWVESTTYGSHQKKYKNWLTLQLPPNIKSVDSSIKAILRDFQSHRKSKSWNCFSLLGLYEPPVFWIFQIHRNLHEKQLT